MSRHVPKREQMIEKKIWKYVGPVVYTNRQDDLGAPEYLWRMVHQEQIWAKAGAWMNWEKMGS